MLWLKIKTALSIRAQMLFKIAKLEVDKFRLKKMLEASEMLRKELFAVVADAAECETCYWNRDHGIHCDPVGCENCECTEEGCICQECREGSQWKWKGV